MSRVVVKQLTTIAFKFAVLWVLMVEHEEEEEEEEDGSCYYPNLVQSLSHPTRIVLRYAAPHTLVNLIYAACHSAAFEAQTLSHTTQKKWLTRKGLERLDVQGSSILCSLWRRGRVEGDEEGNKEDPEAWTAYREAAAAIKKKKVQFPPLTSGGRPRRNPTELPHHQLLRGHRAAGKVSYR